MLYSDSEIERIGEKGYPPNNNETLLDALEREEVPDYEVRQFKLFDEVEDKFSTSGYMIAPS